MLHCIWSELVVHLVIHLPIAVRASTNGNIDPLHMATSWLAAARPQQYLARFPFSGYQSLAFPVPHVVCSMWPRYAVPPTTTLGAHEPCASDAPGLKGIKCKRKLEDTVLIGVQEGEDDTRVYNPAGQACA